MASVATMEGIWAMLETLSLSNRNKKWLSDKLLVSIPKKEKTYSKEDQEILDGFREALYELEEIKAGRAKAIPLEEAIAQIKAELKAEGYEFD